jgi:hypothetical protein
MDVNSVLGIAGALQAQRTANLQLETALKTSKDYQDLQKNVVAQLLASLPNVNPDGVGGKLDITV